MSFKARMLVVNNIKLPVNASSEEAFSVSLSKLRAAGIRYSNESTKIFKRSIDARKKDDIKLVYSVIVEGEFSGVCEKSLLSCGAQEYVGSKPEIVFGNELLAARPVVVGAGPAGLFAALILAENGYMPIVLERGGSVEERIGAIQLFKKTRMLDTNTNIQFGAGGAGTFSDGKLITRINDAMSQFVLDRFVEFGAPEEITYLAKPHIGTDVLCRVVDNMIDRIIQLGAEVRFHTAFIGADFENSRITRVRTTSGEIEAGAVILAPGHSARDTYAMLLQRGLSIEAKNFSVGMRIEHLTEDIDNAMFGSFAGNEKLGHAEYALSHNTKERGVYTFCMCPGGEVVCAASEEGGVVVNGMSNHNRGGRNSNSAVVCSIFREDYGATPAAAIEFQRRIERAAFTAGGNDYSAPIITFGDFVEGRISREPKRVIPTYMDGKGIRLALPETYLPTVVTEGIKNAVFAFDRRIKGFAAADAVLTGAETRTSAPLRILRNSETRLAFGYENLYPTGEGAGYAGGITSAAIDGIRTALAMISKYRAIRNG